MVQSCSFVVLGEELNLATGTEKLISKYFSDSDSRRRARDKILKPSENFKSWNARSFGSYL